MKKPLKIILLAAGILAICVLVLVLVSCILYSPEYIYRCIANGESKVTDYSFFPERVINGSSTPYLYRANIDSTFDNLGIQYTSKGVLMEKPLDVMARETDTSSLIVVHNDEVVYEKYFNGYDKDSVNTSFSAVKSIDSLLIGIAIDEGFIQSEDQLISEFIPEFKGSEFSDITIKQLLLMRSKIKYEEGNIWFGDNAKTYYLPDLRSLALKQMSIDKEYDGQFHYNNYHPLLLGIILERCTGMNVSAYFQSRIWEKVGAENDASWSIDSEKSGFEKMESGLNFKAIDFMKIGSMVLHNGMWNGNRVVSQEWLSRSVIAPELLPGSIIGYQYMWYSVDNDTGGKDYFANGRYGQLLYVSPDNNTVVLRTGTSEGGVDIWIGVLMQLAYHASGK